MLFINLNNIKLKIGCVWVYIFQIKCRELFLEEIFPKLINLSQLSDNNERYKLD